ncbi:MAG: IS630 family transposase [Candidatus Acidiferrales bacterium]|jgi:transposase
MGNRDARSLPAEAQEDLRRRVVKAVQNGLSQSQAARIFAVARPTVNRWMQLVEREGSRALQARRRGRPRQSRLAPHQAATTVRMILSGCPDQLSLPFALWTREAVQQLLSRKFNVQVSVWTVGRYLRAWGLTPQKPVRRAYEQDPVAVRKWLEEEYPAIRAQARQWKAQIHWLDEMGLRSDHQAGRSYGRRGQTPVVLGTGQRFRCNMISSITNRGRLSFMIFRQRFTARVFLNFLNRLLRQTRKTRRKIFLIVDGHPVHKSRSVRRWLAEHAEQIRIFCLPSYSPELNPDELLNQDVKTNALGRVRPVNVQEMMGNVRSYLRITQARPKLVKRYFRERHVQYAAR